MKDVIVIGGGPGGYVAAIRASQLGMKTTLIERENLGGICLNWGCIPSKALLKIAYLYQHFKEAEKFGIRVEGTIKPDISEIIKRSRKVAEQMSKGVEYLMRKNNIEVIKGHAKILGKGKVEVTLPDNSKKTVEGKNIIIAVGARARSLPELPIDGKRIISYREALTINYLPEKIAIVGAGPIGVEFAYFFQTLGSSVTLIEVMDRIIPLEDPEISSELERNFRNYGIKIYKKATCKKVETSKKGLTLTIETEKGTVHEECDVVLSAAGITPNTENLGLETVGIKTEKGKIIVDEFYRTTAEGFYSIGDCINLGPHRLSRRNHLRGIHCREKPTTG